MRVLPWALSAVLVGLLATCCNSGGNANAAQTVGPSPCACEQWTTVGPVVGDLKANAWEHILVNFSGSIGNIVVSLPGSSPNTAGARVRISEVSADGGVGHGRALLVDAALSPSVGGGTWADPLHRVGATATGGESQIGAWIEWLDLGDGWVPVAEGVRPKLSGM